MWILAVFVLFCAAFYLYRRKKSMCENCCACCQRQEEKQSEKIFLTKESGQKELSQADIPTEEKKES